MKVTSIGPLNQSAPNWPENVFLASTERGPVVTMLDPATIAILKEIGTKLLLALGVKALEKLFGNGKSLQVLLENLVKDIAEALRTILDLDQLRDATQDLASVQQLLVEYANEPSTNTDLLSAAKIQSLFALNRIKAILPMGATAYALGSLIRIAALQEQYLTTKVKGDLKTMNDFAASSAVTVASQLASLSQQNERRITRPSEPDFVVVEGPRRANPDIPPRIIASYWSSSFMADGQIVEIRGKTQDEASILVASEWEHYRTNYFRQFQHQVGIPLSLTITDLEQLAAWSPTSK